MRLRGAIDRSDMGYGSTHAPPLMSDIANTYVRF